MADPAEEFLSRLRATSNGSLPARICFACTELLPIDGAGISLMSPAGHLGTVAASDDAAAKVEELQFELAGGPCVQAFASGVPVLISDVNDPQNERITQTPTFLGSAAAAGVGALFAIPLQIGAIRIGVLDLYRRAAGSLSAAELSTALVIADVAALSLLDGNGGGLQQQIPPDAAFGAAYYFEVHQATGMVMVQLDVPAPEAFSVLRAHAFAHDLSVTTVARDVIARRLRFGDQGGAVDE